jgi:hypothetical protein
VLLLLLLLRRLLLLRGLLLLVLELLLPRRLGRVSENRGGGMSPVQLSSGARAGAIVAG